jgi:uncharacterized protein DUF6932
LRRLVAGLKRIAILGSIVTTKPDPKDIDVLVVIKFQTSDTLSLCILEFGSLRIPTARHLKET